eukprot:1034622-Alexandrium_andersonii.AAC.1
MALDDGAVAVRVLTSGGPEWVRSAPSATLREFARAVRDELDEEGFLGSTAPWPPSPPRLPPRA